MNKKTILGVIIFLVFVTCFGGYILYYKVSFYFEDQDKTEQLSTHIKDRFDNRERTSLIPYVPTPISWDNQYLVLTTKEGLTEAHYNTLWNEDLDLEKNYPGQNLKGLVLVESTLDVVGEYEKEKSIFDSESKKAKNPDKAYQVNYVVHYYDFNKDAIIARDTILGKEPPERKKDNEAGIGKLPTDKELIESIKNRINK